MATLGFPVTLPEMLDEAEEELAMRRRVYAYQVRTGKMKQEKADRKIELMEAIANHFAGELKVVRQRRERR